MRCYFSILRLAKEKVGTGSRCGSESLHSATFAQRACPVPSPAGDIRRSIKFVTLSSFPLREEDVFFIRETHLLFRPLFCPPLLPVQDGRRRLHCRARRAWWRSGSGRMCWRRERDFLTRPIAVPRRSPSIGGGGGGEGGCVYRWRTPPIKRRKQVVVV